MEPKRIRIRVWRVMYIDEGALVFVDPTREHVRIYEGPDPDFPTRGQRVNDPAESYVQQSLWGDEAQA